MRKSLVTLFGAGMSPVAPGTAGSLFTSALAAIAYAILLKLNALSPVSWNITLAAGVVLFSILCVALGPFAASHFGRKDPGPCVLDEAAGICLTLLCQPLLPGLRQLWVFAVTFLAFRLFDVTKPPPARQLERFPDGWGILLDDLAAAVYANLLSHLLLRLLMHYVF